jgi:hypothetical protein
MPQSHHQHISELSSSGPSARLVHRVLHAETADSGNGRHALREADEAAILRTP